MEAEPEGQSDRNEKLSRRRAQPCRIDVFNSKYDVKNVGFYYWHTVMLEIKDEYRLAFERSKRGRSVSGASNLACI